MNAFAGAVRETAPAFMTIFAAILFALASPVPAPALPPVPLDPLGGDHVRPQVAARLDGSLWAVAEDAAGNGLTLFSSPDGGRSWGRALALADVAELSRPALAIAEGEAARLLVAYERDAEGAAPGIGLLVYDLDLGATVRALALPAAPGERVARPRLCVDAPEFHRWYAYLVYEAREAAGGARVELRRSLDLGLAWSEPRTLLPAAAAPAVDFGQQTLHVVAETGAAQRDVLAIRSADFGAAWSEPALLAGTVADESGPRVAAANGSGAVAVAFTRRLAGGGTLVAASVSRDEGSTWADVLLSGLSPAARLPDLCASRVRGQLQAAWLDRDSVVHAYAHVDRPLAWSVPLAVVDAGAAAGAPQEEPPAATANPACTAEAAVVWAEALPGGGTRALSDRGSWPAALVRADGGGDYPTIQAALDDAAAGSEVMLAPGLYVGSGNVDVEFGGREAVIRALEPDPALCVIDCRGSAGDPHRAFRFRGGEGLGSVVRNVTITGGHAALAGPGGGRGGGVLIEAGASPAIEGVVFLRNVAEDAGGGLFASGAGAPPGPVAGPSVLLCRFDGNVAYAGGGGMHCEADLAPSIGYSVFHANRSEQGGGGLDCRTRVAAAITGCTFVLDTGGAAAGLSLRDGAAAVIDRTILAFGRRGPGVGCDAGSSASAEWSDIYGNAGGDWIGCLEGQLTDPLRFNLSADPLFCGLASGWVALRVDSPCGSPQQIGVFGAACRAPLTAADPPAAARLELSAAPNPFNPRTEIRFRLPQPGRARLSVHDVAGRLVALLADGALPAGEHAAAWTGRDARGRALPSGTYICRLAAAGGVRTLRLLLLR